MNHLPLAFIACPPEGRENLLVGLNFCCCLALLSRVVVMCERSFFGVGCSTDAGSNPEVYRAHFGGER